jgi:hypothetical protein
MKRNVTLYRVEEEQVMAYDTVSYYRQQSLPSLDAVLAGDAVLTPSKRIDVPVRRYNESMRLDDQSIAHKESFIAIDPKLEYMIKQPVLDKMEWALKQKEAAMCQMISYQDRISEYNDLPWYKRIFRRV